MTTTTSVDGLVSGLNTTDIITKLMAIERQPQARLTQKIDDAAVKTSAYQALNTRFLAVKDAAKSLSSTAGWQAAKAATSNADLATVNATSSALAGSLSFTIDRLATSQVLVSTNSVAGTTATVVAAGTKLLSGSVSALGLSNLAATGASSGQHVIAVTQSSAGAMQSGRALGVSSASVTIDPGATLGVALDGSTTTTNTINLTAGAYTPAALATMITSASGGRLSAKVNSSGALELATTRQGSAARLAVTSAPAALLLGTSTSASSGTDGVISMDGNLTTISDLAPGGAVAIKGGAGTTAFTATSTAGLSVASASISYSDFGDGSLASYVNTVNSSNLGVQATAIQVSPGQYKLQLQSTSTGVAGAISLDTSGLASLGPMLTLRAAADAQLTVGTGPSAYTITSDKNTIDVMSGVTVSLVKADPATTVTVGASADANAIADKVGKLVDAINGGLSLITLNSKYDSKARTGGIFLGDSTARQLQDAMFNAVGATPGSNGPTLTSAGVSLTRDGTLTFDRAVFLDAYAKAPKSVASVFQDSGSNPNGQQGAAGRLAEMATRATDSVDGLITAAIKGRKTETETWTSQVDQMEIRLAGREANLRRQYNGMETTLGSLRNQSAWLTGQVNSLNR